MKVLISIMMMGGLVSCAGMMPEICKTIDDIATDDAIMVQVDRDAIKKDTDVHIVVDVVNKDYKTPAIITPASQPIVK